MNLFAKFISSARPAILVTLLFLFWFYLPVLLHPNSWLFSGSGDGIRNYFSFLWQTEVSPSWINFNGLNYPYGEHVAFIDGHPLLTFLLKPLGFLHPYLAGIVNELMILSYLVCAFFLYKIFKDLGSGNAAACLGAVAVTVLSPQIFRMGGHHSLSYPFVIPMGWYLLLKYMENPVLKKTFLPGLMVLGFFLVHAYLGMILCMFFFLSVLVFILSKREFLKDPKKYLQLFCICVLPVLLFYGFMFATDTHTHRAKNPYGFFEYTASFSTVFLPHHPPLNQITNEWFGVEKQTWEGWAYTGATTLVALLLFVMTFAFNKITNRQTRLLPANTLVFILPAIALLLFSMAYPFKWGMENALDWFPSLKQFRSPGRFAWVFYYVVTVYSVLFLEKILWDWKRFFPAGRIVFTLLLALYVIEAVPHHKEVSEAIRKTPNLFSASLLNDETKNIIRLISPPEGRAPQAILPLPWAHIGSEFFKTQTDDLSAVEQSFAIAYHARVPILAGMTGRTSVSETRAMLNLFSPDRKLREEYVNGLPSSAPVMILHAKHDTFGRWLLAQADKIYTGEKFDACLLEPQMLLSAEHPYAFLANMDLLPDSLVIFRDDFNSCEDLLPGNGTCDGSIGDYTFLCKEEGKKFEPGKTYLTAVKFLWDYNSDINAALVAEWATPAGVNWLTFEAMNQTDMIYKDFFIKYIAFTVPANNEGMLHIFVKGEDGVKNFFRADEIVVLKIDF